MGAGVEVCVEVGSVILWQYENNGGNGTNVGNHAKTIELQFNTDAEGSASFGGAVTTIEMAPVLDPGNTGTVPNGAQAFAVGGGNSYSYVQMTITDNHFESPDVTGGGDRIGVGEIRFAREAVPEPASVFLVYLASLAILAIRKRR